MKLKHLQITKHGDQYYEHKLENTRITCPECGSESNYTHSYFTVLDTPLEPVYGVFQIRCINCRCEFTMEMEKK